MKPGMIIIPGTLLLDQDLAATAKLVWLCIQLGGVDPGTRSAPRLLEASSGLARHTVLRALSTLKATGWLSPSSAVNLQNAASIPTDLMHDKRLGIQEKMLYAVLDLYRSTHGVDHFTFSELSAFCGVSASTLKLALRTLRETEWLIASQVNKHRPVHFKLRNPAAHDRRSMLKGISRRIARSVDKGEAIMREYLTLLVDSDQYDDNARPGFLRNPYTDEVMEFDRFYLAGVAFEFQGAQHFSPNQRFPDEEQFRKQYWRDRIKQVICMDLGIKLVAVSPEDLTLQAMRAKVTGLLPLNDLIGADKIIRYLEASSRGYREKSG